jgi:alpha-beta hydrolase superfamily lysophospholipase
VVAGFSLGAALALTAATKSPDNVDAVIGLAPPYRIRSNFLARQARWIATFRPWLDLGPREDFARYGAMPTRGIASTMAALGTMESQIRQRGPIQTPWMVVQSEDDEVVDVAWNRQFFDANALNTHSLLLMPARPVHDLRSIRTTQTWSAELASSYTRSAMLVPAR